MTSLANKVFTIHDSVIIELLETGLALTLVGSDKVVILNSTGRAIWQLFDGFTSCSQVVAKVAQQFSMPAEQVKSDVYALIQHLDSTGLIVEKNEQNNTATETNIQ